MSRPNKVNRDHYTIAGRLAPDDMARERRKQSEQLFGSKKQKQNKPVPPWMANDASPKNDDVDDAAELDDDAYDDTDADDEGANDQSDDQMDASGADDAVSLNEEDSDEAAQQPQ